MRDAREVYVTNAGHGDSVTAADFRALAAQREATWSADKPTLGECIVHPQNGKPCTRCTRRVYRYATTPDGARHYCGPCVRYLRDAPNPIGDST